MAEQQFLVDAQKLQAALKEAGANPSLILQTSIDALEAASQGTVQYVDASNPAMSILETSTMIHAASIDQHIAALRRVYPILAQTPDELYNHMSYRDYSDRFASPSTEKFMFFFPENQFFQRAVRVPGTDYVMMTIPRDTAVTVNNYVTFTLQYPIDIKYYDTQQIEVSFDATRVSPIQELMTNMIVNEVFTIPGSQERFIGFEVHVPQVFVRKVTDNVQSGRYFVNNYTFTDQYYMARAWYRSQEGSDWTEMMTTYSPSVYDPKSPTLQLKVTDNNLNVSLPLIYQNTGLVTGEIRVDIYTTKGSEIINLGDYQLTDFDINMLPLDPSGDTNQYTAAAVGVNFAVKSTAIMSGGKDALTFEQLKERVINNSVGPQQIPITNTNIKSAAENMGFDLVPNIDVVTNRIFLATRTLPRPSDSRLITSATIGISTYISDDPIGIVHEWVRRHQDRITFLSKNLYQSDNGILRLMSVEEVTALKLADSITKLRMINSNRYLYTPFYYVLDTSSLEMDVRAYSLDYPVASRLNFISQNPTIELVVNTDTYNLKKTDAGYILQIQTRSGNFYKNLQDNEVYAQLAVKLRDTERYAYWKGVLISKTAAGERIFEFKINTDYDINADDRIYMTNGQIDISSVAPIEVDLLSTFEIFHITTSITSLYKPTVIDQIIGRFQIPGICAGITRESISLEFGKYLKGLWTRGRTLPDMDIYETYAIDVPLVYEEDVFADPPFTIVDDEVVYNYIARAGEVVMRDGQPVIIHDKGTTVYENGKPVISKTRTGNREFDIMTVEGQYYFVNDSAYVDYRDEFTKIIVDWVTDEIPKIQLNALEKTKIYFYPKNQLAMTTILVDDYTEESVPSGQSFVLNLYVPQEVYRSADQRDRLQNLSIAFLDTWVSSLEVSISDAITGLKDIYGDDVSALSMTGLGGSRNLQYALISKDQTRLSLKRNLEVQQDGTYIIREDVTFNFYKADPIPVDYT